MVNGDPVFTEKWRGWIMEPWRHPSLWPHSSSPDVDIGARNKLGDLLGGNHPVLDVWGHWRGGLHGSQGWQRWETVLCLDSLGGLFGNFGASLNLLLHLGNILVDWIALDRPNLFWMMSTCQILMWRNCVIYEEFRRLWLMMAALVMAVNTRIPSLNINIDEPEKWQRMMHELTSVCHDYTHIITQTVSRRHSRVKMTPIRTRR